MAYGFNDGDQRRQSVRLAGRTTPTPRSSSSSATGSQYTGGSQRQPRPTPRRNTGSSTAQKQTGSAATRRRDGAAASSESRTQAQRRSRSTGQPQGTRSFTGTGTRQRQTDVPQLRRNGRRQPGIFVRRSFSHPQRGRSELSPGISSWRRRARTALPPRAYRTLLYRRLPGLFVFGLVRLPRLCRPRSNGRGQAAHGPGRARLLVCVFDPALAVAGRHHAPYLSD